MRSGSSRGGSKSVDRRDRVRTSISFSVEAHRRLHLHALQVGESAESIVRGLVDRYVPAYSVEPVRSSRAGSA